MHGCKTLQVSRYLYLISAALSSLPSTFTWPLSATYHPTFRAAMSAKRRDDAAEDGSNKRKKISLADSVDVNAVMSSEGPIVSVVVLRATGECEELVMDMSPKLQAVAKELGGKVGFLGQWETLEVVLINRADQDDESIPMNVHTLQPPFHDAEVRGDILLMKNNEEGLPTNFSLQEYTDFQKLVIEKWEPGEDNSEQGKSRYTGRLCPHMALIVG